MLNLKFTKTARRVKNFTKGFTLIEMIVSIALFSFVMLASTTVILSVIDANHKAQGLKITINNLSLALENMARNLRTGSNYIPASSASSGGPANTCPSPGVSGVEFTDQYGNDTFYQFNPDASDIEIWGGVSGIAAYYPITSSDVTVERLCFYISGTNPNDNIQPSILITTGGKVAISTAIGAKTKTTSRFDIQTFVSQRLPDVPL